MSTTQLDAICEDISQKYSCCDVADALLKLKCPAAGYLTDIAPVPRQGAGSRLVAPVSTVLFVSKSHDAGSHSDKGIPAETNIPQDKHWTDCPSPGSVVLMQQPDGQICALLGDIVASRLRYRGVKGAIINGRVRDIASLATMNDFQVWSKNISAVGTSLEAKPWAVDVPLKVGEVEVKPGDVVVMDEDERCITVIPKEKLEDTTRLLPELKDADDKVLADVQAGVNLAEAFKKHRGHYTNVK